ncbi:TrmB family transcriptional regulator [Methanoplanus endosymbiosus]|uniref:TrmB family transcriptional regulator n=1 Tax=Methanoplanus endosymbiosus TaxID=33865 RepID=A0A9E7TJ83_9EURY|nr:helix-turn-helix domain-containing protein [Methanoplanus endosymbiosus]UUX91485.1 TrmB family transcriptional regulator [Methanoplanus endosymbiosus]
MNDSLERTARITESLKSLGLTKYEALVYIALLRFEGATATEIHEISGVPRASVYPVLDKLLNKNITAVSNTTPKRFSAACPDEAIKTLLSSIKKDAECAKEELNKIYERRESHEKGQQELIWTIYGNENITAKTIEIISKAENEIRLILGYDIISRNLREILSSPDRKASATIITNEWKGEIPDNCTIWIIEKDIEPEMKLEGKYAGICIVDDSKVLVSMDPPDDRANALFSESNGFVRFFNTYWYYITSHITKQHIAECISS